MQATSKTKYGNKSKKVIKLFAIIMIAFMTFNVQAENKKTWSERLFSRQVWEEVDHSYATAREVCKLVENNIKYTKEGKDKWETAKATWFSGKGDCEDMAICVQELCRISGISSKVYLYFSNTGKKEGHAILVGEIGKLGKLWFSSNGSYEEANSEKDLRNRVAKMLSCKESQLWGMKLDAGNIATQIAKFTPTPHA